MSRFIVQAGILFAILFLSVELPAQSDVALATRSAKLIELSEKLKKRDKVGKLQAQKAASKMGIASRRELPNGRILELQRIVPGIGPIFYITNNVDAADTVSTDEVWPGGSAGLDLDGSGMVIGEWDGGAVYSDHWDFDSRLTQVDGAPIVSAHSTHVAGTLIGSGLGLDPRSRGMAYAAQLNAYDWESDTAEMAAAAAAGLLVSNHSYGIAAGWIYMGFVPPPDTWWWIGGSGQEDPNFGYYDNESALWDQIAVDAPYYLIVRAAGNDRTDVGPPLGELYTVVDQNGDFVEIATANGSHDPDCAPAGYDCIASASTAKNILTVGAVDDLYGGYSIFSGPSSVIMADFSAWGPTDDGRIKPDVVGNGMFLISAWTGNPFAYAAAAGTSMASPNVSGSLLLLQEHYENENGGGNYMRAATLKALAIHTADETGNSDGPDYEFGWGLLNTRSAAKVISNDGGSHQIIEDNLAATTLNTVEVNVTDADALITATLVWADPPGEPIIPQVLDQGNSMLVNDLDLRIRNGPATHEPWVLDPAFPTLAATRNDNFRDNVEQVVIDGGSAGTYFIEVSHKGGSLDGGSQDYSLIISSVPRPSTESNILINEDFSGGSLPAGWSLVTDSGIPWSFNAWIPGDARYENQTYGSGHYAMADVDYSHNMDSKLRSPTFDLAGADAVVLKFQSFFWVDEGELPNVEVSTDDGANWTEVWRYTGFGISADSVNKDLTAIAAGQSSFAFQFRFNSGGSFSGNLWQIDDVVLQVFGGEPPADPPGPASSPIPPDGATEQALFASLSWTAGALATSHDVYVGGNPVLDASDFQGNFTGAVFDPETPGNDTTYYWRIDEVNDYGTAAGAVWSFTTEAAVPVPPGQASNPVPGNGTSGNGLDTDLSWTPGSLAISHEVYFGTNATPGAAELQGSQAGTVFDPGTMANETTYYWRIDEANSDGTTAGPVWSFTTEPALQSTEMHLNDLTPSSIPGSKGRWTALVQIKVVDSVGEVMQGVQVNGSWSMGTRGDASCVTNSGGVCSVQKNSLRSRVESVLFTVTDLIATGYAYVEGANEVAPAITVLKDAGTGNQLPVANNDSFNTAVDTALSGNVLGNDDPGDAPATVSNFDAVSSAGGSVSMNPNGAFTYTPSTGYLGSDSFGYTITDSNGDSDSATVSIMIGQVPTGLTLAAVPRQSNGRWYADLDWSGGVGSGFVTITRNGSEVRKTPTQNDGSFTDVLGKRVRGAYEFEVCEIDSGECGSDTIQF